MISWMFDLLASLDQMILVFLVLFSKYEGSIPAAVIVKFHKQYDSKKN